MTGVDGLLCTVTVVESELTHLLVAVAVTLITSAITNTGDTEAIQTPELLAVVVPI